MKKGWGVLVNRCATAVSVLGAVAVLAAGCGGQPAQSPSSPVKNPAAAPVEPTSLIDPRWMGWQPSTPWEWEEIERRVTPKYQAFGFRQSGERGGPMWCRGCEVDEPTAIVTLHAPGTFDPARAQTGTRVDVDGRSGFFRAADWDRTDERNRDHDAILTWPYADNAWATVRGTTLATGDLERLLELARAARPAERAPVLVPLSLTSVPAGMPLSAVDVRRTEVPGLTRPPGTTLTFTEAKESGSLRVEITRLDGYPEPQDRSEVATEIAGKDGRYDRASGWAGVLVDEGVFVEFSLRPPGGAKHADELEDVLNGVTWVPDPADSASWRPIADWVI